MDLVGYAKIAEYVSRFLNHRQIAVAAHNDTYFFHCFSSLKTKNSMSRLQMSCLLPRRAIGFVFEAALPLQKHAKASKVSPRAEQRGFCPLG